MKDLESKKALIFGIANNHSIAWGIAQALHAHGVDLAFSYASPALERRVEPLAAQVGARFHMLCDVTQDEDIDAVFRRTADEWGRLDILVHAIAFANREELSEPFHKTSREGFRLALDISAYSLIALARAARPLMGSGGSILTLTYYGGEKVVPNYNVMGVAKAALEAITRYLAADLGPSGIRVNAISAGPIRTLSAAGVSGFKRMHKAFGDIAPLRRNTTIEHIGGAAAFLCSDMAGTITGEVLFVDSGYNILGVTAPEND